MVSANQFRDVVQNFLARQIGADEFLVRFSELSYNIHKNGDLEAIQLCRQIQLKVSLAQSQVLSHDELRESLMPFVVVLNQMQPTVTYQDAEPVMMLGTAYQSFVYAGTQREEEYA